MLQSYFDTIPRDLEEAAWMEGASRWRTLLKVFLPLAVPAIAVTAIFTFINAWNEFVIALTMLRRQENYTLPIQVFSLVAGRYTVDWHHVMAATLRQRAGRGRLFLAAALSGARPCARGSQITTTVPEGLEFMVGRTSAQAARRGRHSRHD